MVSGNIAAAERPVFIFGSGWRCGSTLLQRLLSSHPDLMIWGENRRLMEHLMGGWSTVDGLQELSSVATTNWHHHKHQGWIALMNPGFDHFEHAMRDLLSRYLAVPAREMGCARWGFKEVRCDATVMHWLATLYPHARFLLIVRHPQDCLASARATAKAGAGLLAEVGGPDAFVAHWARTAESFLHARGDTSKLLVYEDFIRVPAESATVVAQFLNVDPRGFDMEVFAQRTSGWNQRPELAHADRVALCDPTLWRIAKEFGYTSRQTQGLSKRLMELRQQVGPNGQLRRLGKRTAKFCASYLTRAATQTTRR